jgi:ABC-type lipoprotein release transport system permease subunit
MKVLFKLAYRNILGAGLRTWLNVGALSFGFVVVIWMQGLYEGMLQQMITTSIDADYGGGQYWHKAFEPYDPLTLEDAHAKPSAQLQAIIDNGQATPILLVSGSIFPHGRAQSVIFRGIDPKQDIVNIPAAALVKKELIPAMIGQRMAKDSNLNIGDTLTVRWRDVDGTFDATDVEIVHIMTTNAPNLDFGQLWLPLGDLREMMGMPGGSSYIITQKQYVEANIKDPNFHFKNLDFLLADERAIYRSKQFGGSILYVILMAMGLLAIFDTQVLAIFRRRKEIGTLMALGMNRFEVVALFTIEGSMHGILALLVGAVWGIPLMAYTSITGITFPPDIIEGFGLAMGATLYTSYAPGVYGITLAILMLSVIVVSFLPARRISKMKATDAIRGKTQ